MNTVDTPSNWGSKNIRHPSDESRTTFSPVTSPQSGGSNMIINLHSDGVEQLKTIGEFQKSKVKQTIKVKRKDRPKCKISHLCCLKLLFSQIQDVYKYSKQ